MTEHRNFSWLTYLWIPHKYILPTLSAPQRVFPCMLQCAHNKITWKKRSSLFSIAVILISHPFPRKKKRERENLNLFSTLLCSVLQGIFHVLSHLRYTHKDQTQQGTNLSVPKFQEFHSNHNFVIGRAKETQAYGKTEITLENFTWNFRFKDSFVALSRLHLDVNKVR